MEREKAIRAFYTEAVKFTKGFGGLVQYVLLDKEHIRDGTINEESIFMLFNVGEEYCGSKRDAVSYFEILTEGARAIKKDKNDDRISTHDRNLGKSMTIALPRDMSREERVDFMMSVQDLFPEKCPGLMTYHFKSRAGFDCLGMHLVYSERIEGIGPVHEIFEYGEKGSRSEFNKRIDALIKNKLEEYGYDTSGWKYDEISEEYVSSMRKVRLTYPRYFIGNLVKDGIRFDYDDIESMKDIYEIACMKDDDIAMKWFEKKIEYYYEKNEVERIAESVEYGLYEFAIENEIEINKNVEKEEIDIEKEEIEEKEEYEYEYDAVLEAAEDEVDICRNADYTFGAIDRAERIYSMNKNEKLYEESIRREDIEEERRVYIEENRIIHSNDENRIESDVRVFKNPKIKKRTKVNPSRVETAKGFKIENSQIVANDEITNNATKEYLKKVMIDAGLSEIEKKPRPKFIK